MSSLPRSRDQLQFSASVHDVRDLPGPPAGLAPDTFAGRLYAMLAPLAQLDPNAGWSLLILTNAIGTMYQLVEDWVRDSAAGPGWSLLMDVDRCPVEALPWLGQFVGVRLLPNSSEADQRARIASTDGFRRGTPAAMIGAAQATLTGTRTLRFKERSGDTAVTPEYAYYLDAVTYKNETPDPAATLRALLAQKPAGLVLTYNAIDQNTWQIVKDDNVSWQAVKTRYPTWYDVLKLN
jgi:hypothetical protein